MPVDYNLYTHFWSLQEFFSKPNTCFDKISWKTFTSNANDVLEALKSYKLEDVKDSNTKIEEYDDMNLYFSKYLTSEKVLTHHFVFIIKIPNIFFCILSC